ncbi:MAG TPA: TetR/AcrR family transcriptional regulator [Polyangiaceae bacterium]|nr:TetR/AcrR family transcriptional regulator [Polyangiaceae bacterium]
MVQAVNESRLVHSPKHRDILAAARHIFGELGFERASVDGIAARAGVSKATVYSHFQDKNALFVASFSQEADDLRAGFLACLNEPTGGVADALQNIGEKLMQVALSPSVVALYRHAGAESARFPAIGQLLFERGPALVQETLAAYLVRWAQKGALDIPEPRVAAVQFSQLCQGDLFVRAQLGILHYPAEREIRETVARGVAVFLRAFCPTPG